MDTRARSMVVDASSLVGSLVRLLFLAFVDDLVLLTYESENSGSLGVMIERWCSWRENKMFGVVVRPPCVFTECMILSGRARKK